MPHPSHNAYFLPDWKLWIFNKLFYLNLTANSLATLDWAKESHLTEPIQLDSFFSKVGIGFRQMSGVEDEN